MKLYFAPGACSLADHIALQWAGKPFDIEQVSRERMKSPEYLKINPNGAVPALDAGGWFLTQNAAILNYVADMHPEAGLGGDGSPRGRAEVNKWLSFLNADIHPAFHPLFGATSFLENDEAIDKTKQAARTKLRSHYEKLDAQLEGKDWLTGTRSIADPYLFVTLRWAKAFGVDLGGLENLERFKQHMQDDPGVQAALKAEGL